jgi:putative transposase
MLDPSYTTLSIRKQCGVLGVARSSYYYTPVSETEENLHLMLEIDKQYLETPSYGRRMMTAHLKNMGYRVNSKRVARLMRIMGIQALYPKPKRRGHLQRQEKFPYLLKNLEISCSNQVWGTDITYIPVGSGYLYLVAILDLYSRFILSWEISDSLESGFCLKALQRGLEYGTPKILHSDRGVQFTSDAYVDLVQSKGIQVSMSGKGRCFDNIFVERFWRSLKYEEVYLHQYETVKDAYEGIRAYIEAYNYKRPHSALKYQYPGKLYAE